MASFVLVHGAFHGGWCWREVATRLRAGGHEVFAPSLTGLGERSHLASPAVDLSTHVLDVVNLLRWHELRANVLLVHYNDLKADLAGEMRRVADFLDTSIAPEIWPALVEAAGFEAMRRDGAVLMGQVATFFREGSERFFHHGTNQRWRGVFGADDLALYDAKMAAQLSPACARWVAGGRDHT